MNVRKGRNDPLGIRMSTIISRLFLGERLSLSNLAAEFGVHERTIYRDLNERLVYLDIIRDGQRYYLSPNQLGARKTDVPSF